MVFLIVTASCSSGSPQIAEVTQADTIIAATPQPVATPRAVGSATVGGRLCYPSEGIPPMTVYARDAQSQATYSIHVNGASQFEIELPAPGDYMVFAWTDAGDFTEGSLGGSYSCLGMFAGQMIYLGKGQVDLTCRDQEDHTPLVVSVDPGDNVGDVYVCDFYSQESVPRP
jgi:hypothetical protein